MDDVNLLEKAMFEYKQAMRAKKMNRELLEHLRGMYLWLFRYSEKYGIPIPKKEEVLRMAERADVLIDEITLTDHKMSKNISKETRPKNQKSNQKFTDDEGNPSLDGTLGYAICFYLQ